MAFMFLKHKVDEKEPPERSGAWYADPYGDGARRWYDRAEGWTDRVEGAGEEPEKTGLARIDEVAGDSTEHLDADGRSAPLSRPVDPGMLGKA